MSDVPLQKTALITGATSGIGFHCADVLAQKGYDLVIIGKNESKMIAAKEFLHKHPVHIYSLLIDLSLRNAAEKIYDFCLEKNLYIDVLICNAGTYLVQHVNDTASQKIEEILNLHVLNPTLLCRYFGKQMKERREGHILIVSSLAAFTPFPTLSLYAASKRYLHHFSKAVRTELKPYNVFVTDLCPGGVSTDFFPKIGGFIEIATRWHLMMKPQKVADKALKGLFKHKVKVTPGWINRLLIAFIPFIPQALINYVYKHTALFTNQMD